MESDCDRRKPILKAFQDLELLIAPLYGIILDFLFFNPFAVALHPEPIQVKPLDSWIPTHDHYTIVLSPRGNIIVITQSTQRNPCPAWLSKVPIFYLPCEIFQHELVSVYSCWHTDEIVLIRIKSEILDSQPDTLQPYRLNRITRQAEPMKPIISKTVNAFANAHRIFYLGLEQWLFWSHWYDSRTPTIQHFPEELERFQEQYFLVPDGLRILKVTITWSASYCVPWVTTQTIPPSADILRETPQLGFYISFPYQSIRIHGLVADGLCQCPKCQGQIMHASRDLIPLPQQSQIICVSASRTQGQASMSSSDGWGYHDRVFLCSISSAIR
jgi:hypothetical protein